MELKAWEYAEFPAFEEDVPGATWLDTTGDEVGVNYYPDVEYECIEGLSRVLQIFIPTSRYFKAPKPGRAASRSYPCVVYVQGSAWMEQRVYSNLPCIARLSALGYVVAVVDNTNRGIEAQYWMDDFLHVRQRKDGYANTQNAMAMAKNFVTKALPEQFEVSKADQIDLLNRSLEFFKENDTFEMEEFANEVIEQPEVIESFRQYKRSFEEENDVVIDDSFDISDYAFRRQQRSYKRVIRLDRKIQIIIDGNRDHVEQGEDERGKYYKVYYSEEE